MGNKLEKECMGIVNQLFDLTEISVEKRQQINDTAHNYLFAQVTRLLYERGLNDSKEQGNCRPRRGITGDQHILTAGKDPLLF